MKHERKYGDRHERDSSLAADRRTIPALAVGKSHVRSRHIVGEVECPEENLSLMRGEREG